MCHLCTNRVGYWDLGNKLIRMFILSEVSFQMQKIPHVFGANISFPSKLCSDELVPCKDAFEAFENS